MRMSITESICQLRKDPINFLQGKRTPRLHPMPESPGVEIAHHKVSNAITLAVVEDRQDMRMFKHGDDARLLMKAGRELLALCQLTRQDFDRHITIYGWLICFVDICHAPF